jgi:hypothetical protein
VLPIKEKQKRIIAAIMLNVSHIQKLKTPILLEKVMEMQQRKKL